MTWTILFLFQTLKVEKEKAGGEFEIEGNERTRGWTSHPIRQTRDHGQESPKRSLKVLSSRPVYYHKSHLK